VFIFFVLAQRQVGETALNDTSSRSHQIIRLVMILIHWFFKTQIHILCKC